MNDMQLFSYNDMRVRTVQIDGEPWFVLADLCSVLDLGNVSMVSHRLDEVNVSSTDVENSRRQWRRTVIVSEPGMYETVFLSRKAEAVTFRRWITSEVLPTIRKTGGYGQVAQSGPELLARAVLEAQEMLTAKDDQIAELEPKAEAYDSFIDADGTYSVGNVAKMLGFSQNKLFDLLRNEEVMIAKGHMRNTPYQRYMHHFSVKAYEFGRSDGTRGTSYTTRVQPSGVEFIRRKLDLTQPVLN